MSQVSHLGMFLDTAQVVHDGGGSNPTVTLARLTQMSVSHEHLSRGDDASGPMSSRFPGAALRYSCPYPDGVESAAALLPQPTHPRQLSGREQIMTAPRRRAKLVASLFLDQPDYCLPESVCTIRDRHRLADSSSRASP